jgi:AraC-like DNA-binding protein
MNDCIWTTDRLFYKHEISENQPLDAYSAHTHNAYELIYFLSGDATHVIEDKKYKLKKGDIVLIRPFKYHFIQIDKPSRYERYDILFDPRTLGIESVSLIERHVEVINLKSNPRASELIQKMDFYLESFDEPTFRRLMSSLIDELFCLLSISPERQGREYTSIAAPSLTEVLRYINENLTTLESIDEVAEKCFVSKSYLFRMFKKELLETPKKYITDKRLLLAERMINDGMRPTAVYEQCGFRDYTTFYRNYTEFFGRSPSEK